VDSTVASCNRRLIGICGDAIRFVGISGSTDADGAVAQQSQSAEIFRALFEFRTNITKSCNFFSDIAHLSYQNPHCNDGSSKLAAFRRYTLACFRCSVFSQLDIHPQVRRAQSSFFALTLLSFAKMISGANAFRISDHQLNPR
jgi:hypothetical protein